MIDNVFHTVLKSRNVIVTREDFCLSWIIGACFKSPPYVLHHSPIAVGNTMSTSWDADVMRQDFHAIRSTWRAQLNKCAFCDFFFRPWLGLAFSLVRLSDFILCMFMTDGNHFVDYGKRLQQSEQC